MSASLLNLAALPGAGPQPGQAQGIAQQATHAAQAHGPLAGFEALLAAFFGDQGAGEAATAAAGQAQGALVAQAAATKAGDKPAEGKGGKAAGADALKTDATQTTAATAATNAAAEAVALALVQQPPAATQTAKVAGDATDGAPAGKAAGSDPAALLAAAESGAETAKPTLGAQVSGVASTPSPDSPPAGADGKPAPAAGNGSMPAMPPGLLSGPGLPDAPASLTPQTQPPPGQAIAQLVRVGEPSRSGQPKDRAIALHLARTDGPVAPTPGAPAKPGDALAAADLAGKDAGGDERDANPPPADLKAQAAAPNTPQAPFTPAANATASANNAVALTHAADVRGSPQTVASLAAEIARKLDARSTRFDVQLEPAGLGKVDVRVEIDAAGKVSAAMAFDNQQAASELKSRAGELQRALEQAGFDLSGGLSFDVAGQGGGQNQAQTQGDDAPAFRGRAFQAVLNGPAESAAATATYSRPAASGGVDIRI